MEFHDLPLPVLDEVAEYAYADDWDVQIVDDSVSDLLPVHGVNSEDDKC